MGASATPHADVTKLPPMLRAFSQVSSRLFLLSRFCTVISFGRFKPFPFEIIGQSPGPSLELGNQVGARRLPIPNIATALFAGYRHSSGPNKTATEEEGIANAPGEPNSPLFASCSH